MNIHKNARLTPRGRERIVMQVLSGLTPQAAARAAGVCPRTVRKWVARFEAEGAEGLKDRSSRPRRLYQPTPQAIVEKVEALRRLRWTGKQIAAEVGVSPATVSRILRRLGLNRLAALEPAEPSKNSAASSSSATASPAIGKTSLEAPAGNTSTSASMTPRASPSHRSWPIRRRRARSPSSRLPSPTTPVLASPSRGS